MKAFPVRQVPLEHGFSGAMSSLSLASNRLCSSQQLLHNCKNLHLVHELLFNLFVRAHQRVEHDIVQLNTSSVSLIRCNHDIMMIHVLIVSTVYVLLLCVYHSHGMCTNLFSIHWKHIMYVAHTIPNH